MQWYKFPNEKVWRVSEDLIIDGLVRVPDYEDFDDLEALMDAIADAATGSVCGLTDFSYEYRGDNVVSFTGSCVEVFDVDDAVDKPQLVTDEAVLRDALAEQYGLLPVEVDHLLANLDSEYSKEASISMVNSMRSICFPEYPAPCSYVRITIGKLEVAYWVADEWGKTPEEVMGAILGAAIGI